MGGNAGAADEEGDADGIVFVHVLFADEAVAAAGDAGIGAVNDNGVAGAGQRVEGIENAADLGIEVGDVAVIFGEVAADVIGRAGPGEKFFIAHEHFAVVPGMLGEKVLRERNLVRRVIEGEAGRHDMRVVRSVKGNVAEEGAVRVGLHEADGFIGKGGATVLRGAARVGDPAVHEVDDVQFHGIAHAAEENGAGALETAREGFGAVVPFAGHEGGVPVPGEGGGPGLVAEQFFIDVKEVAAGQEHGAGRDAGGAVHAALHIGAVEGEALAGEAVEVGGADDGIAEGGDGIGALVIGEEEEDVRPGIGGAGGGGEGQQGKQGEKRFHGIYSKTSNSEHPTPNLQCSEGLMRANG